MLQLQLPCSIWHMQVKLVCTAAVPPQELFREKVQRSREEKESRVLMDELDIMEVCMYEKT